MLPSNLTVLAPKIRQTPFHQLPRAQQLDILEARATSDRVTAIRAEQNRIVSELDRVASELAVVRAQRAALNATDPLYAAAQQTFSQVAGIRRSFKTVDSFFAHLQSTGAR